MTRDEYYAALNKTASDINHAAVASEWSNHKYISKKVINGKTIYEYPEDKASGGETTHIKSDAKIKEEGNHLVRENPKKQRTEQKAKKESESKNKSTDKSKDKKSDKNSKELDKMVDDVIRGKYGNGEDRKKALGDKYAEVQKAVNEKLGKGSSTKVSGQTEVDKIAADVIRGKYGNGEARKKALGDKYAEVQKAVNEKLGKGKVIKSTASSKTKARKKVRKGKSVSSSVKTSKVKDFTEEHILSGSKKVGALIRNNL